MQAGKQLQQQQQQRAPLPYSCTKTWWRTALAVAAAAAIALLALVVVVQVSPRDFLVARSVLLNPSSYSAVPFRGRSCALGTSPDPADQPLPAAGVAAYSVVVVGAYRTAPSVWEVLVLAGGLVATDHDPASYSCTWYSSNAAAAPVTVRAARAEKPGIAYRLTYTPVVISCEFSSAVGDDGLGGAVVLSYSNASNTDSGRAAGGCAGGSRVKQEDEWMVRRVGGGRCSQDGGVGGLRLLAGTEKPGAYNATQFHSAPAYDHLYCGSPLYGALDGQALYEWVSFHFHQFGTRSHFVFYDVGGISQQARRILAPWINLGILRIEDVRYLNQFDGYYHNQYLILNDCLLKSRHLADWVWYFDVDEYMVVKPPLADMNALVHKYKDKGELHFPQHLFSNDLCPVPTDTSRTEKWTVETLLFAVKGGSTYKKHKWAANPRKVSAASVHFAMRSFKHSRVVVDSSEASYYHYHNSINSKADELCRRLVKQEEYNNLTVQLRSGIEHLEYDDSILPFAHKAKLQSVQYLKQNGF